MNQQMISEKCQEDWHDAMMCPNGSPAGLRLTGDGGPCPHPDEHCASCDCQCHSLARSTGETVYISPVNAIIRCSRCGEEADHPPGPSCKTGIWFDQRAGRYTVWIQGRMCGVWTKRRWAVRDLKYQMRTS